MIVLQGVIIVSHSICRDPENFPFKTGFVFLGFIVPKTKIMPNSDVIKLQKYFFGIPEMLLKAICFESNNFKPVFTSFPRMQL